jgi:acetyl esterase
MRLMFSLLALFGSSPQVANAEPVCRPAPAVAEMLEAVKLLGNPLDDLTPESAKKLWLQREYEARNTIREIPMAKVQDIAVPSRNRQIPVRVYTPKENSPFPKGKLPVMVFIHGGGWTLGSLATYDNLTRALASKIPGIVISVDYRLAPEFPFPAAVEDSYAVLEWAARNAKDLGGDPAKLFLGGDSGGGNIAAVLTQKALGTKLPLKFQALFYPSTDLANMDYGSYREFEKGYLLTKKSVEDFRSFYLPNKADWEKVEASPIRASKEVLAKLPPALIVVAGCDVLRDEGIAYAEKLREAGGRAEVQVEHGMVHGFLGSFNNSLLPKVSAAVEPIIDTIAKKIRAGLLAK